MASTGVAIDANWHDVKVEFVGARIRAWVDGVLLIDYTDPIPLGGSGITFDTYTPGQISVDNVTMTTPAQFSATGSVVSSAFDAGAGSTWQTLSWTAAAPAGTSVKLATRTADSAAALESAAWSGPYASSGLVIANPDHRWMQYKAELATTNPSITPCLYDVTATYAAGAPPPPDPTPTTLSVASSANPSVVDAAVTYTATVSPTPDGGTVAFFDGSAGLGLRDAGFERRSRHLHRDVFGAWVTYDRGHLLWEQQLR